MSIPLWQGVLLGFVQGLTEFLPVSSTAHLALAQHFLPGFSQPGILFDVMLHVGTLAGVVVFYRTRILETLGGLVSGDAPRRVASWRLSGLLLVAVLATAAVALPMKKLAVEGMSDFRRMGFALCATAVLLQVAQRVGTRRGDTGRELAEIRPRDAFAVGALQAASALFHGLSRSGNTISVGLFSGMSRKTAAEFSFLLSIPTILAAAASENYSAWRHHGATLSTDGSLPAYLAGMVTSGLVGYAAVAVLLKLVVSMKLQGFSVYCALLGAALILFPPG